MKRALIVTFLILLAMAAQAQETPFTTPLVLWSRGDLYRLDAPGAALVPVTANGAVSGAARSPGDAWIAYKAAAPMGLAALDRVEAEGEIADFDLPADILLINVVADLSLTVAEQPADAAFLDPQQPDRAVQRSAPAWAPDGTSIAWAERDLATGAARLMRYDLGGEPPRLLTDLPAVSQKSAPAVLWDVGGIAVDFSLDAASDQIFVVYTPQGEQTGVVGVAAVPGTSVRLATWVQRADGLTPVLGLLYENGAWSLLDPATNSAIPYAEPPELQSRVGVGWRLRFAVDPSLGFYWEIAGSNSAAVGAPDQVALAPAGNALAAIGVLAPGQATLFDGQDMAAIVGTGRGTADLATSAVLWGSMRWVLPTR